MKPAWVLIGVMLIGVRVPVWGDQVLLDDGSKLIGEVLGLDAGKLKLKTEYAGEIAIDAEKVMGLATVRPMNVQMKNSETTMGSLNYDSESGQKLGGMKMALDQVDAIWASDTSRPKNSKDPEWSGSIQLGFDGETGNSDRISLLGRADVRREKAKTRMHWFVQGRYSGSNGVRTANEIVGGYSIEMDLRGRWYAWGNLGLEHDEFEDLKVRAILTGGPGYFWIRNPGHELKMRGGIGYEYENFQSGIDEADPVISLGGDYMVEIAPWLKFTHATDYLPTFEDPMENYRIVSETAGEIPLPPGRWKMRIGMQNKYNALSLGGIDRLDTFYFMSVAWDLK